MTIRTAKISDAPDILDIYSYYVLNTAVTYEYTVPTITDFQNRMSDVLDFYPYLVAEENNSIFGYAYASRYHPREAYDWIVEMTIYIRYGLRSSGIGTKLYTLL